MAGRQQLLKTHPSQTQTAFELPVNFYNPQQPKYLPTQANFIQDWDVRFRGFGGGLGNGKTTAGCTLAYQLSTCFPGNCGYIGRWDGKELVQTTMAEFFRLIPPDMFEVQNKQLGYLRFKREYGGSEIYYGDVKKEEWASSLNLGWFWFDQAEEIDEARWNHGVSRLRRMVTLLDEKGCPLTGPDGKDLIAPTYGFATFNPEGTQSFLWKFFHPDSPDRQPDYKLYQATTYDGLAAGFVRQDYVDAMLSVYPEAARKRYLDGSWDVFEGKVFSNFDPTVHVIDPIPLSPTWTYYVSIDHGLKNPTSAGIWAITPEGIKIRIREHYEGNGKPISYHAACIKNLLSDLPMKPALMILDPACWAGTQSRDNRVLSVADEYGEHGIYPVPGQNEWERTFNLMNEALAIDPTLRHPVTGALGCPRLLAFTSCHNWTREMSNYKWKKARGTVLRNAPDEPIDYNDHAIDETRYFLSLAPTTTRPVVTAPTLTALDKWTKMRTAWNPLGGSWTTPTSWMSN